MRLPRLLSPVGWALVACLVAVAPAHATQARSAGAPFVVVVPLRGMIHAASAELVVRALRDAGRDGADLVVIQIDTPGGYLSSTEEIQTAILESGPVVAAWVGPGGASAASAGFFVLMTADVAAMAPGTSTGSAHPILVGGEGEQKGETILEKKLEHHAAARMRSIVERRGRNVAEAERAVRESVSFTDGEALGRGLVEHVAADIGALIQALDGRKVRRFDGREQTLALGGARVVRVEPDFRQRLLAAVAVPQIAYLLMLLGLVGIYVELTHPGLIAPGVVGALSLLVGLYATTVLSVDLAGALLVLAGIVLLVLEVKVTSYGILGVGGVVALVMGSLMLFEGEMPGVELRLVHVLPVSLAAGAVIATLAAVAMRSRSGRQVAGREGLLGERGEALTALGPDGGTALVAGEYWKAVAAESLPAGARIKVVGVDGLVLRVVGDAPAPRGGK